MKPSNRKDGVVSPESWKCFDNCPVCRLLRNAAENGHEISHEELEAAITEAESESLDQI